MSSAGYGLGASGWGDPLVSVSDPFDALLTNSASIYRILGNNLNTYGVPSQLPVLVISSVPCRLSTLGKSSPQSGVEYVSPKQLAITHYKIFMRPVQINSGTPDAQIIEITPANFIVIEGRYFNVLSVLKLRPSVNDAVHHLEIFVEETLPSNFTPPPV